MIRITTQREAHYFNLLDAQINLLLDYAELSTETPISDDQLLNFLSDLHHAKIMKRIVDQHGHVDQRYAS